MELWQMILARLIGSVLGLVVVLVIAKILFNVDEKRDNKCNM